MESRSAVILCLAVALLACHTLAQPRALRAVDASVESESHIVPEKTLTARAADKMIEKPSTEGGSTKLVVRFPEDGKEASSNEEDDSVRSKKSPPMREMSYQHGPSTTVCIQVMADGHHVVCGLPVGDEKKEDLTHAARFSQNLSPYGYARQLPVSPYTQMEYTNTPYSQYGPGPSHYRAMPIQSPQPVEQQRLIKAQESPSTTPKGVAPGAARGPSPAYPFMRNEGDANAKPGAGIYQQDGSIPPQVFPQFPQVFVHRQFYQSPILMGSPQPALRLNCAVQPDGTATPSYPYLVPPVGSNGIRSASPRIAEGPLTINGPTLYVDSQGSDASLGSPYIPDYAGPIVGSAFLGDDGHIYRLASPDADEDRSHRELLQSMDVDVVHRDAAEMERDQQGRELKEAKEKLVQLQREMRELQAKTVMDEEKKGAKKGIHPEDAMKEPLQPMQVSMPEHQEQKQELPMKQSKRQTQSRFVG